MLKKLNKSNQGFTIIEVLIVLAIAALILLIVFLAVPALQRNSRNTQRKNDVAGVLGAMNEYANNNGGVYPSCTASPLGDPFGDAKKNVKLGLYDAADVTCSNGSTAVVNNPNDTTKVIVVPGAKCEISIIGPTQNSSPSTSREIVALYTVETGGGKQKICQAS